MKQRSRTTLPEKSLRTKVEFKESIPCRLQIAMQGKDYDKLTPEELKKYQVPYCTHKAWPPFSDICISCIGKNSPTFCMTDKKGRTYRIVDPAEKKQDTV